MAKIIVKVHHIKSKKTTGNYVNYIAKREGVDTTLTLQKGDDIPTEKQKKFIDETIKTHPDARDYFEYKDYVLNPTRHSASAFITVFAESNPQFFENRQAYINYISTRPNVEKNGEHGLFGMEDSVDLKEVKKKINGIQGTVWTPIISLKREDAARLGYDNAKAWQALVRSKHIHLAEIFGIPLDEFKWYAAFHNEGGHPHIHMVVYSTRSKKGFIREEDIEKIKSEFAREIFKNDMYELYDDKTKMREKISDKTKEKLNEISEKIRNKDYSQSEVCGLVFDLSLNLKKVKGKKSYGYLPKELKNDVDNIVKALAKDSDVENMYNEWCEIQKKIVGIYKEGEIVFPDLWDNKEFRKIKNAIIKECAEIESGIEVESEMNSENELRLDKEHDDADRENDIENDIENDREDDEKTDINANLNLALTAGNLFYRLARIIEDDTCQKIDGFNKTIVDSKDRIKEIKKKQALGIKMG